MTYIMQYIVIVVNISLISYMSLLSPSPAHPLSFPSSPTGINYPFVFYTFYVCLL